MAAPTSDVQKVKTSCQTGAVHTWRYRADGETIEVGHVGYEGMSAIHLLLKTKQTPSKTFMQVAGSGLSPADPAC